MFGVFSSQQGPALRRQGMSDKDAVSIRDASHDENVSTFFIKHSSVKNVKLGFRPRNCTKVTLREPQDMLAKRMPANNVTASSRGNQT